ncbi:MAG TPA: enoyl-CoA hydratase/isomerase family protein [Solirubrobacterales bacterium]|jgi:enoyl-CoA hydratase
MEIDDSVAVITCTLAEKDLLSFGAVSELADLLDTTSAPRDKVSVVVITGTDGRFVPDVDRDELTRRSEGEAVSGDVMAWHRVTAALESMPQPTVAAVDGNAGGGGCVLALACTLRIGSERFVFGPVEPNLGVVGTDSSANLVRLVGPATGAELLLTEREVDAATAKQIGLINEVLPSKGFDAQARQWCQRIAALPPATVFGIRQAVTGSTSASRNELLDAQPPNSSARYASR